jgi:2,3-bisphosphoglycerate-independent phosphoglycerate mutase
MDRYEADWDMVARGWRCHVHGEGRPFGSAGEAVRRMYAERAEADDQSLDAFVIVDDQGAPRGRIANGDAVFLFNFRGDRAIEISRAFEAVDFDAFDRGPAPKVLFAGMMQYDGDLQVPARFLVPPPAIDRTVGQYLVANGRRSFAISETQKFGHVTFFYNGNRSGRIDPALETWLEVPSDKVPFWQRPWMKAAEVTDAAVEAILSGRYDHVRLNYPNGDMVGHTGDLEATRIAVEVVDRQLARLEAAVREVGGLLLITADHGNADEMWMRGKGGAPARDAEGRPLARTAHTTHPVPFVVVDPLGRLGLAEGPELADAGIASLGATVLACCGLGTPAEYLPALVAAR